MGKSLGRFRKLIPGALVMAASLGAAAQQISGSIRGTVLDPSGAVVPAAAITAKQVETGLTRTAVADRQGSYVLVDLPIGHYQLEVQAPGFQTYLQQGISLDVNETATESEFRAAHGGGMVQGKRFSANHPEP
jgi:hypothetical protein